MKEKTIIKAASAIMVASVLCSCNKPGSETAPEKVATAPQTTATSSSAPQADKVSAAPARTESATTPQTAAVQTASAVPAQSESAPAESVTSRLVTMARNQSDPVLSQLGQSLAEKSKALLAAGGSNESLKTELTSSLSAIESGKDSQAVAPALQLSQGPGLTEGQKQLAKEVGNLASAYVVQRNFSSVPGAQGDVANLVNALRGGQYAATLPPLKNLMNNASLTDSQKQILGSLADKYAPSLKEAAGTLQQGLQSLQNLPGVKK